MLPFESCELSVLVGSCLRVDLIGDKLTPIVCLRSSHALASFGRVVVEIRRCDLSAPLLGLLNVRFISSPFTESPYPENHTRYAGTPSYFRGNC